MSGQALGWVYEHSPYRGATFSVHLAIGDSANDQHLYRLWMSMATIGKKARVDARTARKAMQELERDGFVTMLREGKGTTNLYQFEMPDVPVVYETRPRASRPTPPSDTPGVTPDPPGPTPAVPRASGPPNSSRTQDERAPSTELYAHTRSGADLAPPDLTDAEREEGLARVRALRSRRTG